MRNLALEEIRKAVAETMLCDAEDFSVKRFSEPHRKYLGASVLGESCSRKIWLDFRHAGSNQPNKSQSKTTGQLFRLFNRGQREEEFFKEILLGIGCKFEELPNGKQHRFVDGDGHIGGSIDAIGYLPPKFEHPDKIGFEFKTMNFSEFNRVEKTGVKIAHPKHYAQMCIYGLQFKLDYFLYCVVDKNTDSLYYELVTIDHEYGEVLMQKAKAILHSRNSPMPIALTRTNFACKFCKFAANCYDDEPLNKNCRTCQYAQPGKNGTWTCLAANNQVIPDDVQTVGCPIHLPIVLKV